MKGSDYIAVRELWERAGKGYAVMAKPGERCDRVAEASLPWLLDRGWIRHEPAAARKTKGKE